MKKVLLFVLTLSFLTAVQAVDFSLGFKGGVSRYTGDLTNEKTWGYAGLSFTAWVHEKFGVSLVGSMAHLGADGNGGDQYFESRINSIAPMLVLRPLGKASFSPYLTGGLELFTYDPQFGNGEPKPNNQADVYSNSQLGFPVGGGMAFQVSEKISLDLEALYHFSGTDYLDDLKSPDHDDGWWTASIGVTIHFAPPRDTDGDGILDKNDADPLRAEDFDGYQDEDGAPDLDNDADGIPDVDDQAPLEPEDHDGYKDEDGIPDPDNDGDGIPDVKDKAPNQAEDMDHFQDEDGVPDPDNDGDGIPDSQDKCPGTDQTVAAGQSTAETMNGYQDEDGCPDEKPAIAVAQGQAIVLKGVYFKTNSAELTPESKQILNKVAKTLKENPDIVVEIRGYTDNTGSYKANVRLSQRRAESVRNYLISKGVDGKRLIAKGYGPENPIAPNDTAEGRAKNRRIEFYRIK